MKAKAKAKEKQANSIKSNNVPKLPDQYPTKKNKESVVNLCSSVAELGIEGDNDSTEDEALTTYAYMEKTVKPDPEGLNRSSVNEQPLQDRAHLEY